MRNLLFSFSPVTLGMQSLLFYIQHLSILINRKYFGGLPFSTYNILKRKWRQATVSEAKFKSQVQILVGIEAFMPPLLSFTPTGPWIVPILSPLFFHLSLIFSLLHCFLHAVFIYPISCCLVLCLISLLQGGLKRRFSARHCYADGLPVLKKGTWKKRQRNS